MRFNYFSKPLCLYKPKNYKILLTDFQLMYAEKSFNSPIQKTTENLITYRDLGLNVILSKRKSKLVNLFFNSFNFKNLQHFR
jgi:hypothetical protein